MWAGLTFASAFYMIGFGQYLLPGLRQYIGFLAGWGQIGITVVALVMAALLTGVNYYGVKETGELQNVIVLTLVGLIVAFLGLGIISDPTFEEFNPNGWPAVAATIGTVYVTFIGFEVIATSAEEIKNPNQNLPLVMIVSVVTPTLMYVGVMYVSTGTLSIDALTASQIPVADVATEIMGSLGALAMIVGAVLATVSSANASILSAAHVNFAMGRDRILVNWLNEVHKRFRTPYRAIMATGVITLVLIAIGVGIDTLAEGELHVPRDVRPRSRCCRRIAPGEPSVRSGLQNPERPVSHRADFGVRCLSGDSRSDERPCPSHWLYYCRLRCALIPLLCTQSGAQYQPCR